MDAGTFRTTVRSKKGRAEGTSSIPALKRSRTPDAPFDKTRPSRVALRRRANTNSPWTSQPFSHMPPNVNDWQAAIEFRRLPHPHRVLAASQGMTKIPDLQPRAAVKTPRRHHRRPSTISNSRTTPLPSAPGYATAHPGPPAPSASQPAPAAPHLSRPRMLQLVANSADGPTTVTLVRPLGIRTRSRAQRQDNRSPPLDRPNLRASSSAPGPTGRAARPPQLLRNARPAPALETPRAHPFIGICRVQCSNRSRLSFSDARNGRTS